MRPVVWKAREVQLRLDIDFHALVLEFPLHRPLRSTRPLPFVKLNLLALAIV
jgi:hypothetical protein